MFIKKTVKYKNFELKIIYETLNEMIKNTYTYEISKMILDNVIGLSEKYNEMMTKIYDPNKDTKVIEYNQKVAKIVEKYADRDDNGNIKIDTKNNPIITEKVQDFMSELEPLKEENKEIIDKVNNANENNAKYMNEEIEVTISIPEVNFENNPKYEISPILLYYLFR